MLTIPLIPLFSVGTGCIYSTFKDYAESKKDTKASPATMGAGIVLILIAFSFGPDVSLYDSINLPSAISYVRSSLESLYSLSGWKFRDGASTALMLDKEEPRGDGGVRHNVDVAARKVARALPRWGAEVLRPKPGAG